MSKFEIFYNNQKKEIEAEGIYKAKLKAIEIFKVPKSKQGLIAIQSLQATENPLKDLYSLCYSAHSNTSFSPEKRAEMYVKEYGKMLIEDLERLGENTGNYKEKFIRKFSDWMSAKSRCISSMITGPANFPVRRAQKANDSEHNHMNNFYHWREKYFIAVNRVPTKSPEDEIEIAENRLEKLLLIQIELKEINAHIRKGKTQELSEICYSLEGEGYTPELIKMIRLDYNGKYKIPAYTLTNLNSRVKATEKKVKIMRVRIERKNTWQDIVFEGGRVTIEDDRLKIYHDEKPERAIIQELKSNGYRWSPNWSAWVRKHTGNAIYSLRFLSFINPKNQTS